MKIRFLVINAYAKGGTARTTLDTASRLADRHDVEVVSVNRHQGEAVFHVDPRVRVRWLVDKREVGGRNVAVTIPGRAGPVVRRLALIPSVLELVSGNLDRRFSVLSDIRLRREIRSMRDGLLIGTRPSLNLAIARFARPSVYTLGQEHQYLEHWRPSVRRAIGRAYPRLDAVTGLTPADAASYRALLPAGVLVADMPNAAPEVGTARSDLSSTVVATVGRLVPQKGFDLLVDAFRIVSDRHPDWSLRIYGTGPQRQALARQIKAARLKRKVTLKGFSSSLPDELAQASIFAMSSRFEGFSLALVEAMSVGLPPVAFACPQGPVEIINHGVDGLLIPPEDVTAFAEAICWLIEEPARRAEIAAAARRRADTYSAHAVSERWERLIADLTARPPGLRRG
jgi:glycosyltransferase involved in cell wall biosynthesis